LTLNGAFVCDLCHVVDPREHPRIYPAQLVAGQNGHDVCAKKLFFNLRKAKSKIGALEEGDLHPENVKQIATDLGVTEDEVVSMNRRLSGGDASLNAMVASDGEGAMEWQDWLEDEDADQAADYEARNEMETRRELLFAAMSALE
jgi:RNA polymerase sigma-32 factor